MYHPSRGGVRGGRDQFNWDDVKADKHRENYLGHSVKAPVGRWQKGKDLYWYTKEQGSDGSTKEEIKRIQEEEEDAMKEMLGLAPRKIKRPQSNQLEKREVDELLKKGKSGEELAPSYVDGERVQGLGFAPAPAQTAGQAGAKRTVEIPRNDSLSLPPEQISHGGNVKEAERDVGKDSLPTSEDEATIAGPKSRQDVGAVSSEDEAASRKKRKEEKRKAKELRREAKRARRKALQEERGHRSKYERRDSSPHKRFEDKGRRRQEEETSSDYHIQKRNEGNVNARYEGSESDSSGGVPGRFSMGHSNIDPRSSNVRSNRSRENHERRKVDYDSPSDDQPFRRHKRSRRVESPIHRGQKFRRKDADDEREGGNSVTSSDDSTVVKRRRRERKEESPNGRHQKQWRHNSHSEGYVNSHKEDQRREKREESPIRNYQKQGRRDSDSEGYVNSHKEDHRTDDRKEKSPCRRYQKPRRHDSDSEGYVNSHRGDQRRR